MSDDDLLAWAEKHRYTILVLGKKDILRAGYSSWKHFVATASGERKARAWQRIHLWNAREQGKK